MNVMQKLLGGKPLKTLVFVKEFQGGDEWWTAETPFGTYCIQQESVGSGPYEALGPERINAEPEILCKDSKTFEHARRCCQQHFQNTVMECFEP